MSNLQLNKRIKLGMIGCGNISHYHARAAEMTYNICISSCCDIDKERAKSWAEKYNCDNFYSDYKKMIELENLDGIIITTWPVNHKEHIEDCINSGIKNILCEKALTTNTDDAIKILKLADKNSVFVLEGFMYRHYPAIKKIDHILSNEPIGKIESIKGVFNNNFGEVTSIKDSNRDWREKREIGGGAPYDITCYPTQACNYFARSMPKRVFATWSISKYETIDSLSGIIEYENGCIAFIESNRKSCFNMELQIQCSDGIIYMPIAWLTFDNIIIEVIHSPEFGCILKDKYSFYKADPYKLQLEHFRDVIFGKTKPLITLHESILNMVTIEALILSFSKKSAIEIKIPKEIEKFRFNKNY